VAVAALVISVVALVVSCVSVTYSRMQALHIRRQADAVEDDTWATNPPSFTAWLVDPHSPQTKLRLTYDDGPHRLDDVSVEIISVDTSPVHGFGVGKVEGDAWGAGPLRVGDVQIKGLVQRLSDGEGPPYHGGPLPLRIRCTSGRHQREVRVAAEFPPQPWVY
jgi:hypothetical protein